MARPGHGNPAGGDAGPPEPIPGAGESRGPGVEILRTAPAAPARGEGG